MARVLFDQGTPVPLRRELGVHEVRTAREEGWSTLENGDLLNAAENAGFDILSDHRSEPAAPAEPSRRRISIVVLSTTSWPRIRKAAHLAREAVDAAVVGSFVEVNIP